MTQPVIRSRQNERLRLVRALSTRKGRRKHERFLLEGPRAVREALERAPSRLEQLLFREDAPPEELIAFAEAHQVPVWPVEPELFDGVAPSDTPQPVLAVAHLTWGLAAGVLEPGQAPRAAVACCGVQDPGNLGTILRSAHFFGFAGCLVLPGTHDPWSPKVVRSSAGALFATPPAQVETADELLAAASAGGFTPVALVAHGGEPLGELPARTLLLVGAEGGGLPDEYLGVTTRVTIPSGEEGAESLNVGIAFGIVGHAWSRQWNS